MTGSRYAAKPWLDLLTDAQKAPLDPDASLVHALRRAAAEAPDRTFLAYFDGRLTYREVDELTDSVAGHLAARGLERGERVAVLLQNSPHFVLAVLGAWKAGAVVVPVNPMYKAGRWATSCGTARWPRSSAPTGPGRRICARRRRTRRCGSCSPGASWTSRAARTPAS